jgi:hypothetical protein
MIGTLGGEFEGARFGDSRLSVRLLKLAKAVQHRPSVGFFAAEQIWLEAKSS